MKLKKSSVAAPTINEPAKLATLWPTDEVNVAIWTNKIGEVQVEVFDNETGERVVVTASPHSAPIGGVQKGD